MKHPTTPSDADYWSNRYRTSKTGWDVGYPTPPLTDYLDQLDDRDLRILIPGAGNAYEAEYAWKRGFRNLYVADIARAPLDALKARVPDFPDAQLLHADFFTLDGPYDLILEQTFFCTLPPDTDLRRRYAAKMAELLRPGGKLVGVWFTFPYDPERGRPPYGGNPTEYEKILSEYLEKRVYEPAHNSIPPRAGSEAFGIWQKR